MSSLNSSANKNKLVYEKWEWKGAGRIITSPMGKQEGVDPSTDGVDGWHPLPTPTQDTPHHPNDNISLSSPSLLEIPISLFHPSIFYLIISWIHFSLVAPACHAISRPVIDWDKHFWSNLSHWIFLSPHAVVAIEVFFAPGHGTGRRLLILLENQ